MSSIFYSVFNQHCKHYSLICIVVNFSIKVILRNSVRQMETGKQFFCGRRSNFFFLACLDILSLGNCIPANSIIIITGTPSGVVFNAPNKGFITGTALKYIFTGGLLRSKMHLKPVLNCRIQRLDFT